MSRTGSLRAAFARPANLLLRHRWILLFGLACIPVHAAASLWMPALLGKALDLLAATDDRGGGAALAAARTHLASTCWLLLGLALIEGLSRYVSRKTLIDASRHVEQELKDALMAHLQRLPIAWFDRVRTGDVTSRMTQDAELVRFVMGPLLLHGGSTLCLLPTGIVLMLRMDVPLTLACSGAFGVLFVSMRFLMPRLHRWSKASQAAIGELSQRAQEDFAGIRVVTTFGLEAHEAAAMATRNRHYLAANLRLVRLRSAVHAITHSTSGLVMFAVLLVGGHQVIGGHVTVGQLFEFLGYLGLMLFPLEILGWTLATLPRAHAAAMRIEELFQQPPESTAGAQSGLRGHLSVRNLTFTFPGRERPALQHVSFELPTGGKLGLVGPVGAGKTTLLALCLRFYDPPRGTIFVDGHDVLDLQPAVLRQVFALAPQEPFLFSDTVAANIAFAQADAAPHAIDAAVDAAALDQDLPQLHQGLGTLVGERGVSLSGGQKQRVSLARALLSERPALLLDDTLSAVDPLTERRILRGLEQQRRNRTMIVATHRLSVVADADLILVLDGGVVRERGDHQALIARGGAYAAAWRRQSEAAALEGVLDGDGGQPA